ncbi:MAG: N-acetylmannosamine-6-phosphate 2-epimerase [Candidatus Tyrphobacter sp.]
MSVLGSLTGKLVVSVQVPADSPLREPAAIAALCSAAVAGGAAGVRIESAANVSAVRTRLSVPVIGIVKRSYDGFEPYITPTLREVEELLAAGAQIVAFDATPRRRPDRSRVAQIVSAIRHGGALAMADCAHRGDGASAFAAGAEILATTLCGYTRDTSGAALPALPLVGELATFRAFTICEGGIADARAARAAFAIGADAIVVGTAITSALDAATAEADVAARTRIFAQALAR